MVLGQKIVTRVCSQSEGPSYFGAYIGILPPTSSDILEFIE
jgi:hypothetical protein